MAGIAFELSPADYLKNITAFSPDTKKIGVIYSKAHSDEIIEVARKEAETLGLQLVTAAITQPRELRYHFKKMTHRIDGFWILADPVVFTLDNFFWLQDQCNKNNILCLGPSKNSVKKGLPIAMSASPNDIGSLAAKVAKLILDKDLPPESVGIIPPLPVKLYCNLKTLQKLQPSMNHRALAEYNSLPGVWQATVVTP
jgi:putative ABC transport system substrate-binding protein